MQQNHHHNQNRTQKRTARRKKAKRKMLILGVLTVGVIAGGSVFAYGQYMKNKMEEVVNIDTIYNGISVNDIDVSGKTKQQALQ